MSSRESVNSPWSEPANLANFNSEKIEDHPSLSGDGNTLVFTRSWYEEVDGAKAKHMQTMVSHRSGPDANWSDATLVGVGGNLADVTADSLTLVRTQGRDLWLTRRSAVDASWDEFTRLAPPVNSEGDEVGGSLSSTGKLLVFQRRLSGPAGVAGVEPERGSVWMATRSDWDSLWSEPLLLRSLQEGDDTYIQHPRLQADDETLLYSANHSPVGDQSYGEYRNGFDIYMARRVRKPPIQTEPRSTSEGPNEADQPAPAISPFIAAEAVQYQEAWAKHLGVPIEKEVDLGGGTKLSLVLIPPGEFSMGSTAAEQTRFLSAARKAGHVWAVEQIPSEGPQHRVRITRPFYLGRYEVTQAQWRAVLGVDPSYFKGNPTHPVDEASWDDIQIFLKKLNEEAVDAALTFSLPTEAQWEYACRAGTTTPWPHGADEAGLVEYGWIKANSGRKTHPVGQLQPNAWGLHDLHGNVDEWCSDWSGADYYDQTPTNDPPGAEQGIDRVRRGGGWDSHPERCRSACRSHSPPDARVWTIGFRIAAAIDGIDAKLVPAGINRPKD